jgi:pimeloyl-ACP methyl ester carboxylesterase
VLSLEAALRLGDLVDRVVLYDAPYVHDEAERAAYAELAQQVRGLLDDGENARAMRAFLRGIGMPATFVALLPLMPGWRTMKALAPTLAYDIALTRDLPPVARAAEVAVPLRVMAGEKSGDGVNDVARQLTAAVPGAELVTLAGEDHMVSAKALLPHLVDFLKQG